MSIVTGMDKSVPLVRVIMTKETAEPFPKYYLPAGYKFVYYKPGMAKDWARIQVSVDHLPDYQSALDRFQEDFGDDSELLKARMLFVADRNENTIATATMWLTKIREKSIQRLHWIAVEPKHQGQRISHAMLTELLSQFSSNAPFYLTTQTWSYRAIAIYLKFGFKPYPDTCIDTYFDKTADHEIRDDKLIQGWQIIRDKINGIR